MKKFLSVLLLALMVLGCAACLAEEQPDGASLSAWSNDVGWTSFSAYADVEALDDAWEAAAAAFGPAIGMNDLDAATLKALNAAACGFEDGIVGLNFSGDTATALDSDGNVVFSREYRFVEAIEDAIEGAPAYVYATDDAQAGQYAYLCMTLPGVASEEGGVITNFSMRCAEADYAELFAADYAGATHVLVRADTPVEDVDYTIRLVYNLGAVD